MTDMALLPRALPASDWEMSGRPKRSKPNCSPTRARCSMRWRSPASRVSSSASTATRFGQIENVEVQAGDDQVAMLAQPSNSPGHLGSEPRRSSPVSPPSSGLASTFSKRPIAAGEQRRCHGDVIFDIADSDHADYSERYTRQNYTR